MIQARHEVTKVIITEVCLRVDRAAWSNTCCLYDCRVRTDCVEDQSGTKHAVGGTGSSLATSQLEATFFRLKKRGRGCYRFTHLRWRWSWDRQDNRIGQKIKNFTQHLPPSLLESKCALYNSRQIKPRPSNSSQTSLHALRIDSLQWGKPSITKLQ